MIYSKEVEEMCTVAQGVHHGCAPIPEEAKWVQAKEDVLFPVIYEDLRRQLERRRTLDKEGESG